MTDSYNKICREDWSPHGFYDTMRRLFRPRPDPRGKDGEPVIRLVEAPFYRRRPLKPKEFHAAEEMYINSNMERRRLNQEVPPHDFFLDDQELHDRFGVPPGKTWPYSKALGRLYFAETKDQQSRARQEVKILAHRGPRALRRFLATVLRHLPQRRLSLPHIKVTLDGVLYRKKRQFVWAFLRREAMAGQDCSRHDLRNPRQELISELVRAYSFLDLTPDQLKRGLANSHQADEDMAEWFGLSTKTIRSLLSKHHPLAKSDPT